MRNRNIFQNLLFGALYFILSTNTVTIYVLDGACVAFGIFACVWSEEAPFSLSHLAPSFPRRLIGSESEPQP